MRYPTNEPQKKIEMLEDELWMARYAIVHMAPEEYVEILESYRWYTDRHEFTGWLGRVVDQILEMVQPLSDEQGQRFELRATCPLCGADTSSPYVRGFVLPEGLRRHLTGSAQNQMCAVTRAADKLKMEHYDMRFAQAEKAERAEERRREAERKRTEVLLRTEPDGEPVLMDDVPDFGKEPRNEDEWAKAESRLQELGFNKTEENRVRQYVLEGSGYKVIADPRDKSQIVFNVYRKPIPTRKAQKRSDNWSQFVIKDSWKHDIPGKFNVRLDNAIAGLSRKKK